TKSSVQAATDDWPIIICLSCMHAGVGVYLPRERHPESTRRKCRVGVGEADVADGVDTIHFETPVALNYESFMRQMVAGLGHLNEGILGSDVAGAYVMNVGLSMGAAMEVEYKRFWGI